MITCTPRSMPCCARSRCLTDLARGSAEDSAMSQRRNREGSALAPAPAQQSTGTFRRTHAASSAT